MGSEEMLEIIIQSAKREWDTKKINHHLVSKVHYDYGSALATKVIDKNGRELSFPGLQLPITPGNHIIIDLAPSRMKVYNSKLNLIFTANLGLSYRGLSDFSDHTEHNEL